MIQLINGIAETWFRYMASATLQATLLALSILGLLLIFRRWSPALRYGFMMLALCKFVIPPMLSLPTGLFNHIRPQWSESAPPLRYVAPAAQSIFRPVVDGRRGTMQALPDPFLPKPVLTTSGKLLLVHLSGAVLILAGAAIQKLRLGRLAARATAAQDPALAAAYEELCRGMKLFRKPRLLISRDHHAPMTFGTWKPVVMLPQALVAALPLFEIRAVLCHELAHTRRRDPWIAWVQVIISAIWWFNPVYWLLSRSIRSVREDCCDDMVLASGLASREVYCGTLLKAARAALENKAVTRVAFAYLDKSQPLRRRFKRIMGAKFIRAPKLAMAGMLMIFALALVLLPGVEPRILAQSAIHADAQAWSINTAPLEIAAVLQNLDKPSKIDSGSPDQKRPGSELPGKPQNKNAPTAAQMAEKIIDLRQSMRRVDRDQEYAAKVEQAAREFLQQYPDSEHAPLIRQSLKDSEEALVRANFEVAQYYAGKANYAGAMPRLETIMENYPDFSLMDEVKQLYESLTASKQQSQSSQKNAISNYYRKWIDEDVAYIIPEAERTAFLALKSNQERDSFIEQFWARRNPDTSSTNNSFKVEFYRRIAYANEHFAWSVPGWKTDRGRIYILYGKPDEVESHPTGGIYHRPLTEGGGTVDTYPFEKWWYRQIEGVGNDILIEFIDLSGTGEYRIALSPDEKQKSGAVIVPQQ